MMSQLTQNATPIFRTAKRRKTYRHRPHTIDEDTDDVIPVIQRPSETAAISIESLISLSQSQQRLVTESVNKKDKANSPLPITSVLYQRRKNRRTGGVEFKADAQGVRDKEINPSEAHEETEDTSGEAYGKLRLFSRQTGAVGDVDRHMMAYIDSELAKRRYDGLHISLPVEDHTRHSPISNPPFLSLENSSTKDKNISAQKENGANRQPATLGMLLEIDLGDEVRERNVEMTEKARKKLGGEIIDETEEYVQGWKGNKVKLGPDGKPRWGRRRRHSDDYKRDQLVDQVLKENRLEIYDEPTAEAVSTDNDQAADDRIAEAFRREFLDSVSARQRKKSAPAQPAARGAGGKKEEVLRGPKLGGSRSARAAVRESLLKSSKK